MKKIIAMLLAALLAFSMVACSNENNKTTDPSATEQIGSLNMRQKRILVTQGLPTTYDLLTEEQKKAIANIEEMLCYAEDKYGYPCEYIYFTNEFTEDGVLTCVTSEGDAAGYEFNVYKDQGVIKDTYALVACTPVYAKEIEDYMKENFSDVTTKVYPLILGAENISLPITADQLKDNLDAECWILIDSATCTEEQMKEIAESVKAWQTENLYSGITHVSLIAEGVMEQITRNNFAAYLDNEYELAKESYDIFTENE